MSPAEFAALAYALVAQFNAGAPQTPAHISPGVVDSAWEAFQNIGATRPPNTGGASFGSSDRAPSTYVSDMVTALGYVGVYINA